MTPDKPTYPFALDAEIDDDHGPANWFGTNEWPFKRRTTDPLVILRKSGKGNSWVRSCTAFDEDEAIMLTLLLNKGLLGELEDHP